MTCCHLGVRCTWQQVMNSHGFRQSWRIEGSTLCVYFPDLQNIKTGNRNSIKKLVVTLSITDKHMDRQWSYWFISLTGGQIDGHYQTYYLHCFAINKYQVPVTFPANNSNWTQRKQKRNPCTNWHWKLTTMYLLIFLYHWCNTFLDGDTVSPRLNKLHPGSL